MIGWAVLSLASATEPTSEVRDDGTVVVKINVEATPTEVKALLADTEGAAMDISADLLSVTATQRGACEEVRRETRGVFRPFEMKVLKCPTPNGFVESLVASDDFSAYQSTWSVQPGVTGSDVTYSVRTELNAPVPGAMVRKGVLDGARNAIVNLARKLGLARR